jgi:hypothetical protein
MYYKFSEQLLIQNTLEKLLCQFDLIIRSIRSKTIIDCELWKDVLVRSFIVNEIQGELMLINFLAQLIKKFLIFVFYEIITFFNGTASQTCLINLCWKRRKNKNVNFWKKFKKEIFLALRFFQINANQFPKFLNRMSANL